MGTQAAPLRKTAKHIKRRVVWCAAAIFAAPLWLGGVVAVPAAHAQYFSESYDFLKAVKNRDGNVVVDKLNKPGNTLVNTRDLTSGETALHIVTKRYDTQWIRFLTKRGADPNIADKKGITPLQIAVTLGYIEGAEALIKAGAEVNVVDSTGETPLITAVHRRDLPMIRLLLASGADINRTDNSGRSALDYARLMNGNSAILEEFERAEQQRKAQPAARKYGP